MRHERTTQLAGFLEQAGWADAERTPLAGDASNRRYDRLLHAKLGKAVLMDAPPETGEDIRPFIAISKHLAQIPLSAPRILASDPQTGFLLLEDLGDDLFARVLERSPEQELQLYAHAIDALVDLQRAIAPEGTPNYGPAEMTETGRLAIQWYVRFSKGNDGEQDALSEQLASILHPLLQDALTTPKVLVHRDYHAENLLWLPNRDGVMKVGIIDFQDAMMGHPAYDLASLLKDARRDVDESIQAQMIDRFIEKTGASEPEFRLAYALCSVQRNLRILGVFTRLCVRDNKPSYPDLIPRVWANLQADLKAPELGELREFVQHHFPHPSPDVLARIKAAHV